MIGWKWKFYTEWWKCRKSFRYGNEMEKHSVMEMEIISIFISISNNKQKSFQTHNGMIPISITKWFHHTVPVPVPTFFSRFQLFEEKKVGIELKSWKLYFQLFNFQLFSCSFQLFSFSQFSVSAFQFSASVSSLSVFFFFCLFRFEIWNFFWNWNLKFEIWNLNVGEYKCL